VIRVHGDLDRVSDLAAREALLLELGDGRLGLGRGDVVRLERDHRGSRATRELVLDLLVGLDDCQVLREELEARRLGVDAERRDCQDREADRCDAC
jgi:hypothetical protein